MLDEAVAHLGDVKQTVVVNADVYEAAEVNHVSYSTLKLHIRLKIIDVKNVGGEDRCGCIVTDVTARLLKLGDNILKGRLATAKLTCKLCNTVLFRLESEKREVVASYVLGGKAEALQKILCNSVGLGVNARSVKYLLAARNTKEACALGKRLLAKLRNLKDLSTGLELAVLLSVLNYVLCNGGIYARNVSKESVLSFLVLVCLVLHAVITCVNALIHHPGQDGGEETLNSSSPQGASFYSFTAFPTHLSHS